LTTAEIMSALEKHGATNIVEIRLKEKIDTIGDVVIASGASRRHLKKMAETIVAAVGA
jgi:ribosomal silencing factor RsfS